MPLPSPNRIRVAAIDFLNPAPLMWDFEHPPGSDRLSQRYQLHYTHPAQCAVELNEGRADLGLIPIAALNPDLAIVPGCTIASLDRVRSIQLIIKQKDPLLSQPNDDPSTEDHSHADQALAQVRTIAADIASRSSLAYAQILFRKFVGTDPTFLPASADPVAMLTQADAALLIGDPALLAIENRAAIESHPKIGSCLWLDLAHQWRIRSGLPWVAAVWAARPAALTSVSSSQLTRDLQQSRDRGLTHIEQLVAEWTPRIALPPATIRSYLNHNIHYTLDAECIAAIELFRRCAAEADILPPLPHLNLL